MKHHLLICVVLKFDAAIGLEKRNSLRRLPDNDDDDDDDVDDDDDDDVRLPELPEDLFLIIPRMLMI